VSSLYATLIMISSKNTQTAKLRDAIIPLPKCVAGHAALILFPLGRAHQSFAIHQSGRRSDCHPSNKPRSLLNLHRSKRTFREQQFCFHKDGWIIRGLNLNACMDLAIFEVVSEPPRSSALKFAIRLRRSGAAAASLRASRWRAKVAGHCASELLGLA
jgi:hypothetical protein